MCRACLHTYILDSGSLSLYAPGKNDLAGRARIRPPTPFAFAVSLLRADAEAAAWRKENSTYWRPATSSMLAVNGPVRLVDDLVDFESLGRRVR